MVIPVDYIAQKFKQYSGGVVFHKRLQNYQGSCSICREGNSWLKKKRSYYLIDEGVICCHNCGWYSSAINWIKEVTKMSYAEIVKDSQSYDLLPDVFYKDNTDKQRKNTPTLPEDSINLLDPIQCDNYKKNSIVEHTLQYISQRRLNTAINQPKSLWLSLTDLVHKNRLIIPFYGVDGKILTYQSRSLFAADEIEKPKYLSKVGGERALFGINQIDNTLNNIYIFEGPLNAFFCKNGTAVAGIQEKSDITLSPLQRKQINNYPLHKHIWVLDSQWVDNASLLKTDRLIDVGERVFIWPKTLGVTFKDFNDICIAKKLDSVPLKLVDDNIFTGLVAKMKLAEVKRLRR